MSSAWVPVGTAAAFELGRTRCRVARHRRRRCTSSGAAHRTGLVSVPVAPWSSATAQLHRRPPADAAYGWDTLAARARRPVTQVHKGIPGGRPPESVDAEASKAHVAPVQDAPNAAARRLVDRNRHGHGLVSVPVAPWSSVTVSLTQVRPRRRVRVGHRLARARRPVTEVPGIRGHGAVRVRRRRGVEGARRPGTGRTERRSRRLVDRNRHAPSVPVAPWSSVTVASPSTSPTPCTGGTPSCPSPKTRHRSPGTQREGAVRVC